MTQSTMTRRVTVALAAVGSLAATALVGVPAAHAGPNDPVFRSYQNGRSLLCLAVDDPSLAAGSKIVQLPCTGRDDQYWFVTNNERDDHWAWRNKADETKCLTLPDPTEVPGVQLTLENCDDSERQLWGASMDRCGAYHIMNFLTYNMRIGVAGGSNAPGAPVVQLDNGDQWPTPDDEEPWPPQHVC